MPQSNGTAAAQNILSLNDSTSPLVEQIETACKILDIGLEGSSEGPGNARKYAGSQGPREEWTLRWLLKKLETAEGNSPSVLLELKVWLLIGELIPRLPLTNLARLLRDHGFLNILQNTLKSLADVTGQDGSPVYVGLRSPTDSSNASSEAGSSSATIEPDRIGQRSKKRNRDGTYKERSGVTPALELRPMFCRLCGVLRQLQALVQDELHGYAVEHLRMVLRAPPEQATNLFGRLLTVAYNLFLKESKARVYEQKVPLRECIESCVHMWQSRSLSIKRSSTNLLFVDECFLPMLEVLTAFDDLEIASGELNGPKDTLERLLLQHVVIPVRETFENARKPRVARDDESVGNNADELLGPLGRLTPSADPKDQHDSITLRPIAYLYSIIVKYTPLDTSKHRVSEKGWLQFMFDRLTAYTSILVLPSPAATNALKEMLKTLLAKKVKLEVTTLERILSSVSHVLGDQQSLVNWDIISLCLQMDPDVFVVPMVSQETVPGKPVRIPNRFLRALFDKSYLLSGSLRTLSPDIHQSVLEDILIPLVDGFVHARDLSGFIEHWITNLEHSRSHLLGTDHVFTSLGRRQAGGDTESEDRSPIDNAQALWEHETLLEAVASHIETRLTTGQIEKILQNAKTVLLDVPYSANEEKGQSFLANLVVLDCILGGCTMENTVAQLSSTIEDLYPTLLKLAASGRLPSSHSWRVWRSIAIINNRWKAQSDKKPEVCSIEEQAVWRALELVSYMDKFQPVEVDDVLQSCNFVLSVIHNLMSPLRGEYAKHLMKSFTNASSLYGEFFCAKSPEAEHIASHQVKILRDSLPLIIRDLCSRPAVLLMVDPEEQTVFFKELFKCSILIAQGRLENSVDLWQTLSTAKFLEDNRSLATTFRAFQLDALLGNITYGQDNLNIDSRTIQAHAIESIHQSPLYAFDGKQRSRIFNRVTERLVASQSLTFQSTVNSLKLLINSLVDPRRSMTLLVECCGSTRPWQKSTDQEKAAVPTLFEMAFALDEQSDSTSADPEVLVLFKGLAQEVLEYQRSSHAGDQGDSYLSWYWTNMLDMPRCASRNVFVAALTDITVAFYKTHFADIGDMQQMKISDYFSWWLKITFDLSNVATDQLDSEMSKVQPFVSVSSAYLGLVLSSPEPLLLKRFISTVKLYQDDFSASKAQGAVIHPISNSVYEQTIRIMQENQALVDLLDAIPIPSNHELLVSNGTVAALSRVQNQLSLVTSVSEPGDESQQQRDLAELAKEMDVNEEGVLLQLRKTVVRLAGKERQYRESLSRPMEHLINAICSSAMQPRRYRVFISQLRIIDTTLQKHPRAITQWLIDQIMTLIATSASRSSSSASANHITPKQKALQYLALCRVFSTILAFHRKRLGGRNHLILLVLQSLLRPLFIPFAPAKSGTSAPSDEDHPFTAVHAAAYSRLLSQIVDPPLASLQPHTSNRNHRNNNLNDPTKTAKSIAGQYLHHLIASYCKELLEGRLGGEAVRREIEKGMAKVAGVVGVERLRVMNSGLGRGERGVWRGVWGEWRRLGWGGGGGGRR